MSYSLVSLSKRQCPLCRGFLTWKAYTASAPLSVAIWSTCAGVIRYWSMPSSNLNSLVKSIEAPEMRWSPCYQILLIFGCFWDEVPKVLQLISSLRLSKNSGWLMMATTSLPHFSATLSEPSSYAFYSLVTCWVIGTDNICFSPFSSVTVFMFKLSINSCSLMNLFKGYAHPSAMVYK